MANTNELKFQISAEDKASKTLENIQKRLDTLDGVLKKGLKGLKLDIDDKTFKSALKQVISDINNNPYKIKLGVNKSVFRSAISDAIKSISEKPFKLPLNVNIKQKDINSAIGNIETSGLSKALNVKLNLDATQAFRTLASVIKNLQQIQKLAGNMKVNVDANVKTTSSGSGAGSSSKLGSKSLDAKIEKEYESLLQKRNKAMSDMDKAYQASNDNSKDIRFLKSRKEFFKAQDRLMKFYNESGMTDSKSMVRDLEKRAGLYSENSPIRASIMKALDTANIRLAQSPDLNIVRRESASDAHNTKLLEYQKLANNNKIKEQADKEVEQQKLLNEYLKAQQQLEDARLKKMRDEEVAAQKLVNAYQKQLELQARQSASWNRVERQRDRINKNKDIQDTKDLLKQQAETLKIKTQIDDKDLKQFIKDLEKLRNLTNNTSLNFYQNMAKNLGIGNETALAKAMRQQQQDLQKQFQSNWWKQDGTLTQGSQQIPTSAKQVKSTYQSMAAEAKKYAQQAEMAWRNAGNKSSESFEKYRDKFQKQMEKMVDFRKNLGNLSYGAEANIFSNMARSVGQANPVYDSLINRVKSLREAQERYRREVETTNERLRREAREQGRASRGSGSGSGGYNPFETWWQRIAYATRLEGRGSKGIGSAMEGLAQLVTDLGRVTGGASVAFKALAVFTAVSSTVLTFSKAIEVSIRSIQMFGNMLIQIGQSIYTALRPGIELYKQQQSAIFSFTAALQSNGVLPNGQSLREMGSEGRSIARGVSTQLIEQATFDAEMSAFSLEEILRALQGVMPMLMQLGMSAQQAYEVTKGVAGVAKFTQLAPNQVLQETRDLAQGSITARTSQVANALGISNEDLAQYKGNADALFKYLMEKFKNYSELLNEFEDTAVGRWQQLQERWSNVTKNIVEGIAPQFKGLFETIIEATGRWEDKNGNYFDAIKSEWHNADGELIATTDEIKEKIESLGDTVEAYKSFGIDYESKEFVSDEMFVKIKDALVEIVEYVAKTLDYLKQWAETTFGIVDPIDTAKIIIERIVDLFAISVVIFGELIQKVIEWKTVIINIIKLVAKVTLVLADVVVIINMILDFCNLVRIALVPWVSSLENVKILLSSIADAFDRIMSGDFSGAFSVLEEATKKLTENYKNDVKKAWDDLSSDLKVTGDISYELLTGNAFESLQKLFGVDKLAEGSFYKAVTKDKDQKVDKGDSKDKNASDLRGEPREDTKALKKALKEAIKQSQKELKARLAELRASLEDTLDRLKEILEENEMKYKQGFMTIDEYYSEKARIELEEAQAKLEEAQAERKLIETAMYDTEEDREKALAENDKKINKYTKETAKMEKGVREVSRALRDTTKMLGDFINTMKKGTLVNGKVVNGKQGSATVIPTSSLIEYGSNQGITKDIIEEVVKQSAQYGANADNYAKMAIAMMIRESGGNKDAISPVGAIGLMQLMPDTAEGLGVDPYNWVENIAGGLKYIDQLAQEFGWDIDKIIAGYNAGPQAVKEYGGVPPYAETQEHVRIVSGYYNELDQLSTQAVSIASETAGSIYDAIDIALNRDGYLGQTLENGRVACVEAGTKLGSYYSDAFKEAVNRGIINTDVLDAFFDEIGIPDVKWNEDVKNSLSPGDIIYLDSFDEFGNITETNSHVMLYKGNGMVVGNFSSKNGGAGGVGEQDIDSYLEGARKYSWQIPSHIRRTGTYGLASGFSDGDSIGQSINTTAYLDKNALAETEEVKDFISKTLALKSEIMEGTFGYPMQKLQQLQIEYEDEVKKITGKWVNSKNPQISQAGVERLEVLKKKHDLEVAKLLRNSLENQFDYQIDELKRDTEASSIDIYSQRTGFGAKISELIGDIDNKYGLGKLIDELEKTRQGLLSTGRFVEANELRDKINSLKTTIIDIMDSWIEQGQKYWENAEAIFDATTRFTPTQREFAEREFKAYRSQREYDDRTQKGIVLESQYKSQIKAYNDLIKKQKGLVKGSDDYYANQKKITEALQNSKRTEMLMAENEQMKKLANLSSKMPDYLDDIGKAARDALDNGLVEFLTDGITEAESLSDALRDLATGILKEIQKVSAKWMVKGLMNGLFGQFDVDKEMPLDYTGQLDIINNSIIDGANRIVGAIGGQVGQSNYQGTSLLAGVQTGQPRSFELNSWQKSPFYSGQAYAGLGAFSSSWGQSPLNPNAQTQTQTVSQNFSELSGSLADVNTQFQTTSTMSLPSFTDSISDVTNDIQADTSIGNSTQQLASQIDMGSSQFQSAFSQVTSVLETVATTLQTIASSLQSVSTQISSLSFGMPTGAATGALVKNNRILKFAKGGAVFRNSGLINGPGSETSDSIPAMLSNGEAVLNAKAVKELGVNFISAVNNGQFSRIRAKVPHFSSGGTVNNTQQMTARGMSDFARNISTNVSTNNQMNIALVKDEREAMEHFLRSPQGQRIMVDFQKGSGRVFSRFSDRF